MNRRECTVVALSGSVQQWGDGQPANGAIRYAAMRLAIHVLIVGQASSQ